MLKKNKDVIFIALLCLLPLIYGFFIYDKLPEMLPTHWNFKGEIDGYTSKFSAIVYLPLALFAATLFSGFVTKEDPKNAENKPKIIRLSLIMLPIFSNLLVISSMYIALGNKLNITMLIKLFIALVFIILGNYMPKLKRNYTIGIKTPWTLHDDEIWQKTHRLGGKIMILQGLLILVTLLLNNSYLFFAIICFSLIPLIYSYLLYLYKKK